MKRSTIAAILSSALLVAVLTVCVVVLLASRSYAGCASRIVSQAPPSDRMPPERFRRLARVFWSKHNLYLSRVIANECTKDPGTALGRFSRRVTALSTLSARLPPDQTETLAAVLIPANGGRGITHSARTEWGRPPEALNDAEMTWLFVVGQSPTCSRAGVVPERDKPYCDETSKRMFGELREMNSGAPGK
ncbi:MAG: hypothetical protein ACJ75H_04215 [Thermoanaerobaculia bacterium]